MKLESGKAGRLRDGRWPRLNLAYTFLCHEGTKESKINQLFIICGDRARNVLKMV
jgi:hypothetical protein